MQHCRRGILLIITLLVFACLYAPQPVFPYLADFFDVNPAKASELVTRIMLVLCLGALLSGLFLRAISARTILLICVPALGLTELLFASVDHIDHALALKTVEGFLFSAILPALMTALADTSGKSGTAVAWYVSASVTGSVCGRFLSGSLISVGEHSLVWISISVALLLVTPGLLVLDNKSGNPEHICLRKALRDVLSRKDTWACSLVIIIAVLTLASVLNYLPFQIRTVYPNISAAGIATLYIGYILAIVSSISAPAARRWLGNDRKLFRTILLVLLAAMTSLGLNHYGISLVAVAAMCGCVFMLHSGLSAYLNQHVYEHRRVVNGIYLTSYYLGGASSSFLPGWIYMGMGWLWLLAGLFVLLVAAIGVVNLIDP